jgi:hypothetical protein
VVLIDRLREIRALLGFYRHTMDRMVEPDLGQRIGFLPAIEVFGEGVFLRIEEEALRRWESLAAVRERAHILRSRLAGSFHARWIEEGPTPRLLLIHTLGHLLMRQMSFDAGYSSSSLRERIFADDKPAAPLAGLLIYTAAGDAEGSLGGLARLGEPERLVPVFARALGAAQWCSLDPVCRESNAQGPDGLSLAACHACVLASETSCILGNLGVDDDGPIRHINLGVSGTLQNSNVLFIRELNVLFETWDLTRLVAALSEEVGYRGGWLFGVELDHLGGHVSQTGDPSSGFISGTGITWETASYTQTVRAAASAVREHPKPIASRLLRQLLRGLGTEDLLNQLSFDSA